MTSQKVRLVPRTHQSETRTRTWIASANQLSGKRWDFRAMTASNHCSTKMRSLIYATNAIGQSNSSQIPPTLSKTYSKPMSIYPAQKKNAQTSSSTFRSSSRCAMKTSHGCRIVTMRVQSRPSTIWRMPWPWKATKCWSYMQWQDMEHWSKAVSACWSMSSMKATTSTRDLQENRR